MESEQQLGVGGGRPRPNSAMFSPISTEPPPKVAHTQHTGEKHSVTSANLDHFAFLLISRLRLKLDDTWIL